MLAFVCQKYLLEHLKINIVVSCLIENVDTLEMYLNEKSEMYTLKNWERCMRVRNRFQDRLYAATGDITYINK